MRLQRGFILRIVGDTVLLTAWDRGQDLAAGVDDGRSPPSFKSFPTK
jgi:hypothetical protein